MKLPLPNRARRRKNFIVTPEKAHFTQFSGGIIPACNIGIGLKVGTSLFLIFTVLAALHVAIKSEKRKRKAK